MAQEKRIFLIGPVAPFRGGISQYTTMLHRALKELVDLKTISFTRQYPKILYPAVSDRDDSFQTNYEESGVHYSLDTLNPITWLKTISYIIKFKPDLVIFQWWHIYFFPCFYTLMALLKYNRIPISIICHNVMDHERAAWKNFLNGFIFKIAKFIIVHTEKEREKLYKEIPQITSFVHPHPIYIHFQKRSIEGARKADIQILFFGFVRPYKGVKTLVDAIELIGSESVHLTIVGEWMTKDDTLYQRCKSLSATGRVDIIDRYITDKEVASYFEMSDVVVLPYLSVTGSGVLTLAYHFNKPVIATRIGCFNSLVKEGKTGYLVEPGNPYQLAEAIKNIHTLEKKNIHRHISEIIKEMTWEHLAHAIMSKVHSSKTGKITNDSR